MICYSILDEAEVVNLKTHKEIRKAEKDKLENLINDHVKNENLKDWLTEARNRTDTYIAKKEYFEPPKGNWSEIKEVYKKLQANKCAYCEQKLEDRGIAHDVEHYRPKKIVRVWLNKARKKTLGFDFDDQKSDGYYKLPYNIFNYVTSCKVCNTSLKGNYFPIEQPRKNDSDDPDDLRKEKPYIPYTLGNLDEDKAEDLISFEGYTPIINPNLTDPNKKNRALLTIKFFELEIRKTLIKQRCEVIKQILEAIETISETGNPLRKTQAEKDLERLQAHTSEHANCARSFYNICLTDADKAFDLYEKAVEFIEKNPNT
ncbi:MAG: hypothetical protein WA584_17245 [Pyrinomonadaceae bacterium]